jgi:hypothetical protein
MSEKIAYSLKFLALGLFIALVGCTSQNSASDSASIAAQSCSVDLGPATPTSQIVPQGFDNRVPGESPVEELQSQFVSAQRRAVISAEAASIDSYWQPLADAWAIHEALVQALIDAPLPQEAASTSATEEGAATTPPAITSTEFVFTENVNIDFAAIAKDTYCRIAFLKSGIPVTYETTTP